MEYIKLNNGTNIPALGFGTWCIDDGKAAEAVRTAIELGYRHIDTAQAYGNERGVGEGGPHLRHSPRGAVRCKQGRRRKQKLCFRRGVDRRNAGKNEARLS